jgi:transcriptional regulator of arginine metabolism
MPSDRSAREKRQQAILSIFSRGELVEEQKDLVHLLRERGIPATQSSISRDLRDLGIVRLGDHYVLPDSFEDVLPFRRVAGFVKEIKPAGPYLTLMKTEAGAGPMVAQAIDLSGWEEVVGTVAGHSSTLILTDGVFDQKLLFARLKRYQEEEPEST